MKNEICLVTGGAGFIGSALSGELCARFGRVVVVDNLHPQIHKDSIRPALLDERAELVIGDITDPTTWTRLLESFSPSVVIHLAAETGTGQSLTESARHAHVNVTGTAVMLDALSKLKSLPRRIILTSSRAVYGEGAWESKEGGALIYPGQRTRDQLSRKVWDFPNMNYTPATAANTNPMPVSIYGATKLTQEHMISAWCNALDVEHVFLRLQNVYGPGQSLTNSYTGIVSLFCRIARDNKSIPLYEDGAMVRDFVLIDDVVSAIVKALDYEPARLPLDVGSGECTTILAVADIISRIYNSPSPHVCELFRFGDVRHASCDILPTIDALRWKPGVSVGEGLGILSSWVENQLS